MVGYHGTKKLSAVLSAGLRVQPYKGWGCPLGHICISTTPEIAASYALGDDAGIVAVNLDGLELPREMFVGSEMRLHFDVPPDHVELYTVPVIASKEGHVDPAKTDLGQHPTCIRLMRERGILS